jgi:hypothetical protein
LKFTHSTSPCNLEDLIEHLHLSLDNLYFGDRRVLCIFFKDQNENIMSFIIKLVRRIKTIDVSLFWFYSSFVFY